MGWGVLHLNCNEKFGGCKRFQVSDAGLGGRCGAPLFGLIGGKMASLIAARGHEVHDLAGAFVVLSRGIFKVLQNGRRPWKARGGNWRDGDHALRAAWRSGRCMGNHTAHGMAHEVKLLPVQSVCKSEDILEASSNVNWALRKLNGRSLSGLRRHR